MIGTRVEELRIEKFRRFRDISIPLGENVTLVAGQNGTSKSTLLGMLAQPFSFGVRGGKTAQDPDNSRYTDNYHKLVLRDFRDLANRHFVYECDNVFRLSRRFDTIEHTYRYWTVLANVDSCPDSPLDDNTLFTQNRGRDGGKRVRFVTGPGPSHKPGEGNYPHPVVYLGLNRLWPLAEAKTCTFTGDAISAADRDWYVNTYNDVLCLAEHDNSAQFMDASQKRKFVTPASSDYDGESCSAGQDNLGQLLTAILSFRHLSKELGTRYRGGLLLIDEVDATLHAYAQDRLLRLLCDVSTELNLQVVATTHSLRLLKMAFESPMKKSTRVIYLANSDGAIALKNYNSFEEISADLSLDPSPPRKKGPRRVSVVLEDPEAQQLFHQICGSKLRNYISIKKMSSFGAGDLKNLATLSTKLHELQDLILVPDGDMDGTWPNPPKNMVTLPGAERPETLVYNLLYGMLDSDPFWGKCSSNYSRQIAITKQKGTKTSGAAKKWTKDWFGRQSKFWGINNERVFKSWVASNKKDCLKFAREFIKMLKGKYRGKIPQEVIDRTLSPLK